jgi:hypothetical protein
VLVFTGARIFELLDAEGHRGPAPRSRAEVSGLTVDIRSRLAGVRGLLHAVACQAGVSGEGSGAAAWLGVLVAAWFTHPGFLPVTVEVSVRDIFTGQAN